MWKSLYYRRANETGEALRKVAIQGLILDPFSRRPILVLRAEEENLVLPIWIGTSEANAIALQLEGIQVPRPMTHDLMSSMLGALDVSVQEIRITDLRDNTYFAEIVLSGRSASLNLDARPSDAVALALRTGSPVFVAESVFESCYEEGDPEESYMATLKQWLEGLDPEELGQYKM